MDLFTGLYTHVFKDLALSLYIGGGGLEGYTLPPSAIVRAVRYVGKGFNLHPWMLYGGAVNLKISPKYQQ